MADMICMTPDQIIDLICASATGVLVLVFIALNLKI